MLRILRLVGITDDLKIEIDLCSPSKVGFNFQGGCEVLSLINLPPNKYQIVNLTLPFIYPVGAKPEPIRLGKVDLIFNEICDPDSSSKALKGAIKVCELLKVPVINEPKNVLNSGRDRVYQMLKDIEGLYVPKTIKIFPKRREEVIEHIKTTFGNKPVLLRPAGEHTNKDMDILKGEEDAYKLDKYALDGRAYYLTEFVDYKSEDGLYKKYRVFMIDGKPYPRHMIVSKQWNIHAGVRKELMEKDENLRNMEKEFLETFKAPEQFEEIYRRLGLDYFCIDYSYYKGKILIFEANACCKYTIRGRDRYVEKFRYPQKAINDIRNAIVSLIEWKTKS